MPTPEVSPIELLQQFVKLIKLTEGINNLSAQLDRLVIEMTETRGAVASLLAFTAGLAEQLRQNAHDENAIKAIADDMDSMQSEIAAALPANPGEGEVVNPPPAEGGGTTEPPADGGGEPAPVA